MENTQAIGVVDVMKSIQLPEVIYINGEPIPVPPAAQQSLWDAIDFFSSQGGPLQFVGQQLIDIFYDVLSYEVRELLISSESG
ncbi:MAG: hypothetical protein GWN39_16535, partial [Thermoplasmata archaeon]|nr:hypothetical protein [Thermoplasmata archaeon]NIV80304.1 hypothetical protein [Thermoplasmata archaeon]NIW90384.1 hypothetical protein [Thermoplasmata archaeon]